MQKSKLVTFVLAWFLGIFGVHRFYTGKIGTGILWLLTGGGFGLGVFVDVVVILMNAFKDKNGVLLKQDVSSIVLIILLLVGWVILGVLAAITGLGANIFSFIFGT